MPIRAVVIIAATVIGLFLLVSFRTPPPSSVSGVALPARSSPSPSSTPPAVTPSGAPPSGGRTPIATATPGATGLKNGSFTGQDFPNFYGDVQVQIIVSGGRITDVKALQYPTDRPQSAYISSVAIPYLHDEVLKAQSAQIDIISGATFTSDSYAQSVQSALARA
jgi:uncharacterized protein with FMN-binding domain